jgi:uncharacterized protein (UPF0332 family)
MFHAARALLYSQGFREKSHHCLFKALIALFVEEDKLNVELVEAFRNAMILRENADYRTRFSKSGAEAVLERSEEFLNAAKEILGKNRK